MRCYPPGWVVGPRFETPTARDKAKVRYCSVLFLLFSFIYEVKELFSSSIKKHLPLNFIFILTDNTVI